MFLSSSCYFSSCTFWSKTWICSKWHFFWFLSNCMYLYICSNGVEQSRFWCRAVFSSRWILSRWLFSLTIINNCTLYIDPILWILWNLLLTCPEKSYETTPSVDHDEVSPLLSTVSILSFWRMTLPWKKVNDNESNIVIGNLNNTFSQT